MRTRPPPTAQMAFRWLAAVAADASAPTCDDVVVICLFCKSLVKQVAACSPGSSAAFIDGAAMPDRRTLVMSDMS